MCVFSISFFENITFDKSNKFIYLLHIPEINTRIQKFNIKIADKPNNRPGKLFTRLKREIAPKKKQTNTIFKINCTNCDDVYVGASSQYFEQRLNNHSLNIKSGNKWAALSKHANQNQFPF